MTLARDLVTLEGWLARNHPDLDLSSRLSTPQLETLGAVVDLARRIPQRAIDDPVLIAKVALQAISLARREREAAEVKAEFVLTLPGAMPRGALRTEQVVFQMLADEPQTVIALGYEISSPKFLARLKALTVGGTRVTLIVDAAQTKVREILGDWPPACLPEVFVGVLANPAVPFAKMHGKVLLVDDHDLLVTSANFTFHGLQGNIEMGVRMQGRQAMEARILLDHLVSTGAFTRVSHGVR